MLGVIKSAVNSVFTRDRPKVEYKEEVINYIKSELEKRQQERLPFELQWRLNMNFLEGNQYVDIDPTSGTIEDIPSLYWWQEREVFNQIAPIIETRLAKLARIIPFLKVRPATNEREDVSSAKVSVKVLESTTKEQKMNKKQKMANSWAEIAGTIIWKTVWNKDKGKVIGQFKNIEEADTESEEASNIETFQVLKEGDIEIIPINPFEFFPDSCYNEDIEECLSVIHAKAYHVKDIKRIWGVDADPKELNVFTLKQGVSTGGMGYRTNNYTVGMQKKKDSALVYEYWEMPSDEYPQGRLIIITDEEILYSGDLPYEIGDDNTRGLPFTVQKSLERPGMFWGKSVSERLIPLQRRYNALKNRKTEFLNRCAIGQILYEEGSIDEDLLEEDGLAPGSMIPYQRGFNPPQYAQYHSLPSTFETEEDRILQDFNRISGVSEISRDSAAPTGVNSGIALSILQEQDDTRLSLTAKNIENTRVEIAKKIIRLYRQFATEPRMLKFVGKDATIEVVDWKGNDLTSEDIYVETSSGLSETPAQRKQMVFDLLGSGLFNDPETGVLSKEGRAKVFEMLELGNWENFEDDDNLHIQKAIRENRRMMQGEMVDTVEYDDDIIHISKHNSFRLTADYEELVIENPQLHQLFEQHVNMHLQKLQMNAMNQQAQMQQQEGGQEIEEKEIES